MWEWTEVENSSNIKRFGFKGETLKVQFKHGKNGALYQFDQVSPETHQAFKDAESAGKFFNKHIQGAYKSEKLDAPDPNKKGSCEGCRLLARVFDSMAFCLYMKDSPLKTKDSLTTISICDENRVGGDITSTPEIKVMDEGSSGNFKKDNGRRVGSTRCLRCTR